MTRDEAVRIVAGAYKHGNPAIAFIEMAEATGLLKFDEPKSPEDELREAVDAIDYGLVTTMELFRVLREKNLKVVRA